MGERKGGMREGGREGREGGMREGGGEGGREGGRGGREGQEGFGEVYMRVLCYLKGQLGGREGVSE